ncbi:hypothetical protein LEP1GSC036_0209 [Leptospira weilii str. 2006001853]|uniref:Uncharacterized protein n=2 Tax=Leptospira weilii TaxID=28184 RepID=A0A828Z689_9LEPT|nr:hypothetical protein LEP1GSC036_0209 [Leptospira weilii str. 2006001853]EMM74107.1 hypothetical protein LEP1GSC038_0077 [Leptospira weilii str. 2006001855]EMN44321.1 hypothetical protein LEP1GSC086_0942 [Leptospira weilii str. LNT 1234]
MLKLTVLYFIGISKPIFKINFKKKLQIIEKIKPKSAKAC